MINHKLNQWRREAWARGAYMSLSLNQKHTGQELGGEFCTYFSNFDRFFCSQNL